jgi:hypothetical protein
MRYVVTYRRIPQELPNGRRTTDGFYVVDRSSTPPRSVSGHITRDSAIEAARKLNSP